MHCVCTHCCVVYSNALLYIFIFSCMITWIVYLHIYIIIQQAKDEIKKLKKDGNYIINLENHNQGGSHWTALILGKKNCLYCDSFGMPPPEQLYLFLEKKYKKVDFSRKEIQDMDSTLCGYFCLEFFKFMKEHPNGTLVNNLQQYQNLFSENTKENDAILAKLFLS